MRPLFYMMRRSLVNRFKQILKKPTTLILYLILVLAFTGFAVMSVLMPSELVSTTPMVPFNLITLSFILIMIYFQLMVGMHKGSSFFRQADVNFAFVAPISPKKVLIYGFIKQMLISVWWIIILFYQIPNLKNHYPITDTGILVFIFTLFLLYMTLAVLALIIYSVTSRNKSYRKLVTRIIYGCYGGVAVWFLVILNQTRNILDAALELSKSKIFSMIPIVGWYHKILGYMVKDIDGQFYMNAVFVVITLILLCALLYYINTDYYEDVLAGTERRERLYAAKKEGKALREINTDKVKKVKSNFGSQGAKAIFYKHLLEYRKSGFFFIGKETLGIAFLGIMSKFFGNGSINMTLYFSIYMLIFISLQGKWVEEIRLQYIYLIPADSVAKVFYGTLANHMKNLVDGLVLFCIAGILSKTGPITIILCAITYMTFGAVYIYLELVGRRFIGSGNKILKTILKLVFIFILIAPGIVLSIVAHIFVFQNTALASHGQYFVLIGYNIMISFVMLLASKRIFEVIEI